MFSNEKDIKDLASRFEKSLDALINKMQSFSSMDLLDLMDFYSASGLEFESELCQRIAQRLYKNDTEVKLAKAHSFADEGNWVLVDSMIHENASLKELTNYDMALFSVEKFIRQGMPGKAQNIIDLSLPDIKDTDDYDFMFDSSVLFRDYGYIERSLNLLDQIGNDYVDYAQVQDLKVDVLVIKGDNDSAIKLLDEMIDDNPFEKSLWSRISQCEMNAGKLSVALESSKNALALGNDIEARRISTYIEAISGKFDDFGFYNYIMANGIVVQDYMLHLDLALHFLRKKCLDDAIEALTNAGMFCPRGSRDREIIVYLLADIEIDIDEIDKAVENLHSLKSIAPNYGMYYIEASRKMLDKGYEKDGLGLLLLATKEYHVTVTRLVIISNLLSERNIYKAARNIWGKIIERYQILPESAKKQAIKAAKELGMSNIPS